jgi:hypothetical protein
MTSPLQAVNVHDSPFQPVNVHGGVFFNQAARQAHVIYSVPAGKLLITRMRAPLPWTRQPPPNPAIRASWMAFT